MQMSVSRELDVEVLHYGIRWRRGGGTRGVDGQAEGAVKEVRTPTGREIRTPAGRVDQTPECNPGEKPGGAKWAINQRPGLVHGRRLF